MAWGPKKGWEWLKQGLRWRGTSKSFTLEIGTPAGGPLGRVIVKGRDIEVQLPCADAVESYTFAVQEGGTATLKLRIAADCYYRHTVKRRGRGGSREFKVDPRGK